MLLDSADKGRQKAIESYYSIKEEKIEDGKMMIKQIRKHHALRFQSFTLHIPRLINQGL